MIRIVLTTLVTLSIVTPKLSAGGTAIKQVKRYLLSQTSTNKLAQRIIGAGLAITVACTGLSCEVAERPLHENDSEVHHYYYTQHAEQVTQGTPYVPHVETSPVASDEGFVDQQHNRPVARSPAQTVGGVIQQRQFTTYVHVASSYRSTKKRTVLAGDQVYVEQDGAVYLGVVEREMPPARLLVGELYGTRIYADAGHQKRIINRDDIKGIRLWGHADTGLQIGLENDHDIFRRDDDDYMERFYGRVTAVYDDGYYQLRVTYGTAPGGQQVTLRDPYVILMHKNIWPFEGTPIVGHHELGVPVMVLGEEGSHIEFLLGEIMQVLDDGFYDIEIFAEQDVDGNQINLADAYRIFVHESTPARLGGIIFARR